MCLLFICIQLAQTSDGYQLILASIRDEFFVRPTLLADFWPQHPNVIGGRDNAPGKEGGTWLAMNKCGRVGVVLNILQPKSDILPDKKGRGYLVSDYVLSNEDRMSYMRRIASMAQDYNGFIFVSLDLSKKENTVPVIYFTNDGDDCPVNLDFGVHAFGNSSPTKAWRKVTAGKQMFENIVKCHTSIDTKEKLIEELFTFLSDKTKYEVDDQLKRQAKGYSEEYMSQLARQFVFLPKYGYGTRSQTVILVDGSGRVDYIEKSRKESIPADIQEEWITTHHSFSLERS